MGSSTGCDEQERAAQPPHGSCLFSKMAASSARISFMVPSGVVVRIGRSVKRSVERRRGRLGPREDKRNRRAEFASVSVTTYVALSRKRTVKRLPPNSPRRFVGSEHRFRTKRKLRLPGHYPFRSQTERDCGSLRPQALRRSHVNVTTDLVLRLKNLWTFAARVRGTLAVTSPECHHPPCSQLEKVLDAHPSDA